MSGGPKKASRSEATGGAVPDVDRPGARGGRDFRLADSANRIFEIFSYVAVAKATTIIISAPRKLIPYGNKDLLENRF